LLQGLLVVWIVVTIVFVLLRVVPADPARAAAGQFATEETIAALEESYGLNESIIEQYLIFLRSSLSGDFGASFFQGSDVMALIVDSLGYTLALISTSIAIGLVIGVGLGLMAAQRRGTITQRLMLIVALICRSLPEFWLGNILILVVAINMGVLPATGWGGPQSLLLPALTMSVGFIAQVTRFTEQRASEVLEMEFVRNLRARGLPERRIYTSHVLRHLTIGLITLTGLSAGYLVGLTFVIELVFGFPGIGALGIQAFDQRDFPLIQGIAVVATVLVVLINLAVDILYAVADPRVRRGAA